MASTLDGMDFDNMPSIEITTAIRILAQATQERFNISTMDMAGAFVGDDIARSNIFPYGDNTPIWSLEDEAGPLADFTGNIANLFTRMLFRYADIEKWNDADTDSENNNSRYDLSGAADAPGTYDNRLFEIIGDITNSYPDLSVSSPAEVKKWYDMIVVCSHILRPHGDGENDDYYIFEGSFDVEQAKTVAADEDGADFFGINASTYEPVGNTTPYSNFKSAQNALFGTLPDSYNTDTDSGTYPPDKGAPFSVRVARASGAGNYMSWTKCFQITYVADWTDSRAAVGFDGRPVSYKHQQRAALSETFPTGEDPTYIYPGSTTAQNERYYTSNVVTEVSDKDEIAVDHDLSAITVPTNITDLSANEQVLVFVGFDNVLDNLFLENWDGDGGFDSFT